MEKFEEYQGINWIFKIGLSMILTGVAIFQISQTHYKPYYPGFLESDWSLLIPFVVLVFILSLKQRTVLTVDGIEIRFFPIFFKKWKYSWKEVVKIEGRKYNPLLEYGGWGIRGGIFRKKRAFNAWGNEGVEFTMANGWRVMIGSQHFHEMEDAATYFYKKAHER